jgi:hypothetical protein
MSRYAVVAGCALALIAASGNPATARVKAGVLDCEVAPGIGYIVMSQKAVRCLFTPDRPGPQERYVGTISKIGVDIGATAGGHVVWGVFTETVGGIGALAGEYGGVGGEATVAVGLGANVMVGGSSRTVALQPLSVSGQIGLNVAAGFTDLRLQPEEVLRRVHKVKRKVKARRYARRR